MKKITSTIKLLVLFTFFTIVCSCTDEFAVLDSELQAELDFQIENEAFSDTTQVIRDARVGNKDGD